jgi:Rrf2 family transcriptional regulator, cysteine metabolism repressor
VKLPVKSDYAARAVLVLARRFSSKKAMHVEDLATEQGVPPNYLLQILIALKGQGIARSMRGKEGGYMLARPPAEISLGDILRAVHGSIFEAPALSSPNCPPELSDAWRKLRVAFEGAADSITFQQLLDQGSEKEKMYYI